MHPRVYREFERICAGRDIRGSVLEVGAAPSDDCLLNMKALANVSEKIGVDLDGPYEFKDFKVVKANGNSMDCFEDARFDAVFCANVLEHDKHFWLTVAEIKRVTKPGGLIVIETPGFTRLKAERIKSLFARLPLFRQLKWHEYANVLFHGTLTFQIHNHPGDFYRFSPQCYREVILEGLENIDVRAIMWPPRVVGAGTKPK